MNKIEVCSNCNEELSQTKLLFFLGKKEKCKKCNLISKSYLELKYEITLFVAIVSSVAILVIGIRQSEFLHISLAAAVTLGFALLWYRLSKVRAKN